jgi:hypothetical protein
MFKSIQCENSLKKNGIAENQKGQLLIRKKVFKNKKK